MKHKNLLSTCRYYTKASLLWVLWAAAGCTAQSTKELPTLKLADPTIYFHDGTYYLYGTRSGGFEQTHNGFQVFTSPDLKRWQGPLGVDEGYALKADDVFGEKGFWAPQIFEYQNTFYMAYTADEHIALATSDSLLGPFTDAKKEAYQAAVKQIDPFIFIDDDGKKYLYHVRLQKGNRIYVGELSDDLRTIKPGTLTPCLHAVEPWEDVENAKWAVSEGPTVIKQQGTYYLFYSANHFKSPHYSVGFATSESPLGPWKKYSGNPVIQKDMFGINGTGHGDVFQGKNGQYYYVMHTHFDNEAVRPRQAAIVDLNFYTDKTTGEKHVVADKSTFRFLHIKAQ